MTDTQPSPNDGLQQWIVEWLARELKISPDQIAPDVNLLTYGVDSVMAMMLVGDLEDRLGRRLTPALLWESPTVSRLVANLRDLQSGAALTRQEEPSSQADTVNNEPGVGIDALTIEEARALLDRLDELSDAEVEAILARLSERGS